MNDCPISPILGETLIKILGLKLNRAEILKPPATSKQFVVSQLNISSWCNAIPTTSWHFDWLDWLVQGFLTCDHQNNWYTPKWVCLKMGYTPNCSHLVGIMISKTIGCRVHYFQTNQMSSKPGPPWITIPTIDHQGWTLLNRRLSKGRCTHRRPGSALG